MINDADFDELCVLWEELSGADKKLIRGVTYLERRKVIRLFLVAIWIMAVIYLIAISGDPLAVTAGLVLGVVGLILALVPILRH